MAEFKNEMFNALESLINNSISNYSNQAYCDLLASHTYFADKLQRNSLLENVKQQALFLNVSAKAFSKDHGDPLKLSLFLYYFYHLSSKSDLNIRNEYVIHMLSNDYCSLPENEKSWLLSLNKSLHSTVLGRHLDNGKYPWDIRFLPEINNISVNSQVSHSNKLSICLYYLTVKSTQEISSKSTNGSMTALDYSAKVSSGSLSDFSDMPVLKHCSAFISVLDLTIMKTLSNENVTVTDDDWCNLILLFNWRTRFYRICSEPLLTTTIKNSKKTMALREDIIINMNIHYKWLSKFLIEKLSVVGGSNDLFVELYKLMEIIDKGIVTQHSPLRPMSKHIKKFIGQPTPFPSENVYLSCLTRDAIIEKTNILTQQNQTLTEQTVKNILAGKHKSIKNVFKSIQDTFNFPSEDLLKKLNEVSSCDGDIVEIIDLQEVNPLEENTDVAKTSQPDVDNFGYQVQLWPIKEYLVIKVANIFKTHLFNQLLEQFKKTSYGDGVETDFGDMSVVSANLIKHLSEVVHLIPLLPVKLNSLLSDLTILQDKSNNNLETFNR